VKKSLCDPFELFRKISPCPSISKFFKEGNRNPKVLPIADLRIFYLLLILGKSPFEKFEKGDERGIYAFFTSFVTRYIFLNSFRETIP
jgi:hypothetical protein